MITEILLVLAFVLFVLGGFFGSAVNPPAPGWGRFNLLSWGLACWVLSILLGGARLLR